jgi:hypothetical protein
VTREEACLWQSDAITRGDLLIWTICKHPKDAPGMFTARPHSVKARRPCDFVLHHLTLDGVRELLPPGLTHMRRDPSDDPVIVETWI